MLRVLWNSRSAMNANQEKLDAISNNLANSATEGYKRIDVSFKDLVYETLDRQGYPLAENNNRQVEPLTGGGVKTTGWVRDNTQGVLIQNDIPTNLAIDGTGYFKVITPQGNEAYTRAGMFNIDAAGKFVDTLGNSLEIKYNEGVNPQEIKFNKDNFHIDKDGSVFYEDKGNTTNVGKIQLYSAVGNNALRSIGESLYVPNENAQIYTVEDADIRQGFIEGSNVNMTQEFTDMIWTQRAFELGSRGIKTADEMWGMINNLRGR